MSAAVADLCIGVEVASLVGAEPPRLVRAAWRVLVQGSAAWTLNEDHPATLIASDLSDVPVEPVLIIAAVIATELDGHNRRATPIPRVSQERPRQVPSAHASIRQCR